MSNIVSVGVSRRFQNLFEAAAQALNLAGEVAAEIIEDLRGELLEGEVMPDLELLQKLIGRKVARSNNELEEGDNLRKHLKNIDRHRREVKHEVSQKLRQALVDVRYVLDRTRTKKEANAFFEGRSNLTRLTSPVLERVAARLVTLLNDSKLGWDKLADAGHRANVDASRLRLEAALADFDRAENESLPEKDALVLALGKFERELEEKTVRLRRRLRLLGGCYQGAGFEREAAALVMRPRRSAKPSEEQPPAPGTAPGSAPVVPSLPAATSANLPMPAAPVAATPEVRRKRRRSRRGSQTPQPGLSSATRSAAAGEAEGLNGTPNGSPNGTPKSA